jgi:hypothetical protein
MRNDNALLATMAMATKREKESPNDYQASALLFFIVRL